MERGRDRLENAVRAVRERAERETGWVWWRRVPPDGQPGSLLEHGKIARLTRERDEARRVAGALYRVYLAVRHSVWAYGDDEEEEACKHAERVIAEAARGHP